ncbi:MAG: hypothetical protein C4583_09070 [Anaerolineaceae bacterium]|nr:MAG: hypothetical protein C4583_09070 [Anaerolineaceae bacterium]
MSSNRISFLRLLAILLSAALLVQACIELNRVAWGTGMWLGEYSPKWAIGFFGFILLSLGLFASILTLLWSPRRLDPARDALTRLRARLGFLRWIFVIAFALTPVILFQYTSWGVVFTGWGIRLLVWILSTLGLAIMLGRGDALLVWKDALAAALVSSAVVGASIPLAGVTSYPFSLGWSEGNRLWDYSILFGRERYIFPADSQLTPFLDVGRQLVGGLPFLYSGLTIFQERLWLGLMGILPYILVGLCVFYPWGGMASRRTSWILAALWGFLFLRQGPIHTPLLISAAVVALAWRRPLWLSLPLLAAAGYFASVSRFTWAFAPAMWAGMLWLASAGLDNGRLAARDWGRAILLGLAGLFGGLLLPQLTGLLAGTGNASVTQVAESVGRQPLLWYRLLPNSTYNLGIIVNLILAITPLVIVLIFASRRGLWQLNLWQRLAILGVLFAFLVVGLVASTKIGGGGDLHNMDMFLIGLLFCAGMVWEKSGRASPEGTLWLTDEVSLSVGMRLALIALVALPAYGTLMRLRPLLYADDFIRLKTLTDIEDPYADPRILGLLPPRNKVDKTLDLVREYVSNAQAKGDVLFMDQRQLLTFGYIKDVPLIAEYEKKYLMDQAMGETAAQTFPAFYRDLEKRRFSLIVSEPLKLPIKDSNYGFSEENNAWVKWVAAPILCYYEPAFTLEELRLQLLVPLETVSPDCVMPLP